MDSCVWRLTRDYACGSPSVSACHISIQELGRGMIEPNDSQMRTVTIPGQPFCEKATDIGEWDQKFIAVDRGMLFENIVVDNNLDTRWLLYLRHEVAEEEVHSASARLSVTSNGSPLSTGLTTVTALDEPQPHYDPTLRSYSRSTERFSPSVPCHPAILLFAIDLQVRNYPYPASGLKLRGGGGAVRLDVSPVPIPVQVGVISGFREDPIMIFGIRARLFRCDSKTHCFPRLRVGLQYLIIVIIWWRRDSRNAPAAPRAVQIEGDSFRGEPPEDENTPPNKSQNAGGRKRPAPNALAWGPPQKHARTDPLVGHGRHFGRTIRTFCRMHTLIANGVSRTMQLELAEQRLYTSLLKLSPGLEERLNTGTEQDLHYVADMVRFAPPRVTVPKSLEQTEQITKGISSARSDDTKSIKVAIVDWITPTNQVLSPPIQRNVKTDRGFHHPRTGELLCPVNYNWSDPQIRRDLASGHLVPSADLWPTFLFRYFEYNPKDAWDGLFRSSLLVKAYKHVFTSPSSVHGAVSKATRSCNARIHGMTSVTIPSIAYIATQVCRSGAFGSSSLKQRQRQVRFALNDASSFCRSAHAGTDSEYFYNLIIDLLEDEKEAVEVADLLKWWNQYLNSPPAYQHMLTHPRQIFPTQVNHTRTVNGESVIAKIKERRQLIDAGLWNMSQGGGDLAGGVAMAQPSPTQAVV
ncbi:hypothetical protein NMY22_g17779 [Coprinellus aureogranulatus]|nr:hypothetical protein NMY22_g17779 [Coprinellus aureogranulatus]